MNAGFPPRPARPEPDWLPATQRCAPAAPRRQAGFPDATSPARPCRAAPARCPSARPAGRFPTHRRWPRGRNTACCRGVGDGRGFVHGVGGGGIRAGAGAAISRDGGDIGGEIEGRAECASAASHVGFGFVSAEPAVIGAGSGLRAMASGDFRSRGVTGPLCFRHSTASGSGRRYWRPPSPPLRLCCTTLQQTRFERSHKLTSFLNKRLCTTTRKSANNRSNFRLYVVVAGSRPAQVGHNRTFVDRCSWTVGRPQIRRQRTLTGRRDAGSASTAAVPVAKQF